MGEYGLNVIPFSLAAIGFTFLRSAIDAYGAVGFGYYLMSATVDRRKLYAVSVLAGVVSIPARLFPVSSVAQVYLCALFMFALSVRTKMSNIQTAAGAVFLGTSTRLLLEHMLEQSLRLLGRYPDNPNLLQSLIWMAPCSATLAVASYLSIGRFSRFPMLFALPQEGGPPGELGAEPSPEYSTIARLLSVVVLVIAFSGEAHRAEVPSSASTSAALTLPLLLFALILWASSHGTGPLSNGTQVALVDLLDLVLLPVLIHMVLVQTGGIDSPYQALHIPLVVTNSLKKGRDRGLISAVLSLLSVTLLGFQAQGSAGSWTSDSNLTIGLVYVLTFYIASRFGSTEAALKKRLVEKATTDDLTDLYNHGYAENYLGRLLGSREGRTYLLMVDLDNFKTLNDSLGHLNGDLLLRDIAADLKRTVRTGDVVARYGGDEFMVIPNGVASEEQVCALGERIRRSIERTCQLFVAERDLQHMSGLLTASCGIAFTNDTVRDTDALIRAADEALYSAKAQGKNRAIMAG